MQALAIRALTKVYGNGGKALAGVDLDVEQGDFFALLGPNGAGKTTLIGIITSLVNKTGGTASVFGYDIDRELERAKSCIGIVPQELNFNQFESPLTIVVNQAGFYGIPRAVARVRAERYLKQLQLWEKRNSAARGLSGGMKRRLMIARALMHEPRLLILDEPSAGVDIEIRRTMWDFLREINAKGTTIILTTHYLEESEQCNRLGLMAAGELVAQGSPTDIKGRQKGHLLEVVVDQPQKAADVLKDDTEPWRISLFGDRLHVVTDEDAASGEKSTKKKLQSNGIRVLQIREGSFSMEDVFISVMEKARREGKVAASED